MWNCKAAYSKLSHSQLSSWSFDQEPKLPRVMAGVEEGVNGDGGDDAATG